MNIIATAMTRLAPRARARVWVAVVVVVVVVVVIVDGVVMVVVF